MCDTNLLTMKWIPVLRTDGRPERVGIRTALTEAGSIRQIAASNPMDNVALLRLLLAVLQWCKPNLSEEERDGLNGAAGIPVGWLNEKLGTQEEPNAAFELLAEGHGVFQDKGAPRNKRPVADIIHELPGASNKAHFRHVRDHESGLCPACFAMGLMRLPMATTSKGSGNPPGINNKPPVYFVTHAATLLGTLALNWPFPVVQGDRPVWEMTRSAPKCPEIGVLEGFTCSPRTLWVDRDSLNPGRCVLCGDKATQLIRSIHLKGAAKGIVNATRARKWRDRHAAYEKPPSPQGDGLCRARDSQTDPISAAGEWRTMYEALVAIADGVISPPTGVLEAAYRLHRLNEAAVLEVEAVGFATIRNDNYLECWSRTFQIPALILTHDEFANHVASEVRSLDQSVSSLLDPRIREWRKRVGELKDAQLLKALASHDGQKQHALRSAFADRLPALESEMFNETRQAVAAAAEGPLAEVSKWNKILGDAVKATTAGSPLRRREAVHRAERALAQAMKRLDKLTEKASNTRHKGKRRRRKGKRGEE